MSDTESEARDSWYNHLDKFLTLGESHGENETSPCIFRVSPALLKEREDAYVPQIQHKECFNEEEKNLIKIEMENLWTQMERKFQERDIEKCYDKYTYYASKFLGGMMVKDACFFLEFFRCLYNESEGDYENILESFFPKFGSKFNPSMRSDIMKDLIKLENQIPLFVLEEVLSMEKGDDLQKAKSSLQVLLKAVFHEIYYRPFDYCAEGESPRQRHILDIYYCCCLGDEEPLEKKKRAEEPQGEKQKAEEHWISLGNSKEDSRKHKSERKKVPSAFRLENGGVKIQASGEIVQDIRFVGKTLHIPPIQLDSDSEIFIRNLVALEVYAPYSPLKRMTAFVQFMNELCPTEKGAAVLREKGVIFGNLEKHSEVTRLFSLCKQSHSLSSCHPIQITRKKLIKYYSRKSRIAAAEAWNEFQKTYFSKPWLLIGGIGATIILILTAVQMKGRKFYTERKSTNEAISTFFDNLKEHNRIQKMVDGGYNQKDLQMPWVDAVEVIMR
ncbi:uncharacterized protein LOC131876281 [Cryptomeria japonica]|uniref:uncharacterized protein LOC131876281 n=1 Tax=Cryptomeria japonica TaxID=3369 RepID=UPI0027DA8689|nr:uncharacterized protein LOC131876281 [Cryptomeria japonica]